MIDIKDKNSLEDNNIIFSKVIFEFDEIFNKIKNIKQKIEEEIEELTISRKTLYNEITFIYEEEYLRLNQEETKIKIELDENVNTIREELQNNLNMINNIILQCEETNKAIINYNQNYDNNKIKTIYYISEINKNNKIFKDYFKVPIKDYKISFSNFSKSIVINENYIIGIPIPKDINIFKYFSKLSISWNICNVKFPEYEIGKLKYKIELSDDIATNEYQVPQSLFILDKYKENIEYKIKIRTMIDNNTYSDWSEIIKFKVKNSLFSDNPILVINENDNIGNSNNLKSLFEKSKNENNFSVNLNDLESTKDKFNLSEINNKNNIFNDRLNTENIKSNIINISKNSIFLNLFEKPKQSDNNIKILNEKLLNKDNTDINPFKNLIDTKSGNKNIFNIGFSNDPLKKTNIFGDISNRNPFENNNEINLNNSDNIKSSLFDNKNLANINLLQSLETKHSENNSSQSINLFSDKPFRFFTNNRSIFNNSVNQTPSLFGIINDLPAKKDTNVNIFENTKPNVDNNNDNNKN